MKKFGLIGGTSWYSTAEYYGLINKSVNTLYGNNTNPPLYLINLNQNEIQSYQRSDDWDSIAQIYIERSMELERIGVEGLAFCANTPHKVFAEVAKRISIPILHIADSIAKKAKAQQLSQLGLLGTRFTMQDGFIKNVLTEKHGIRTIVPEHEVQLKIQRCVYEELSVGKLLASTQSFFKGIIADLVSNGAQGVILGCTEFPLLLKNVACEVVLIDSLKCHCDYIIDFILKK